MMKHGFLIAAILLAAAFRCPAQPRHLPRLVHFSKQQYKAHYQNWSAAQSREGFVFFANTDGLLEFDGSAWSLHPLPEGQTIRSVAAGPDDRIYTGAYEEFGYWKRDPLGRLSYTSLSRQLNAGATDQQEIWHILITEKGIYFQSFGVVFFYDFRQIRKIPLPGNIMFLQQNGGKIIAPVIGQGLFEMNADDTWTFLPGSAVFADKTVTGLVGDKAGMLVATQEAGFFRYNGREFRPWEHPANAELSRYRINRILRLKDGRLAAGTILNGIYIFYPGSREFLHINRSNGLQNNTVLSLFEDAQTNLWTGLDQGIDLLAFSDPLSYYEDSQGIIGTVYTACQFEDRLYIGSNQGLFSAPFQPGGSLGTFTLVPGTQGQVWELKIFDGQLLCGHNQGTFRITRERASLISPVTGGWNTISWNNGSSTLLLQGAYTGIAAFRKDARGAWNFAHRLEGISSPVRYLERDPEGYLWAVNPYEAVFRIKLDAEARNVLQIDTIDVRSGLPSGYNLSLLHTGNEILIWSKDRYYQWDARSRQCKPAELPGPAVPGDEPGKILILKNGDQFRAYSGRLAWIAREEYKTWLPVNLVKNNERVEPLNDSLYLLCMDNGFALLRRNLTEAFSPPPAPLIKSLAPLGSEKAGWTERNALLCFSPRSNSISVQFALPVFGQIPSFRFRLKPLMQEWSDWSAQSSREFSELPPGLYTLELQSNLAAGTASLQFEIAPHWYQSSWMLLFYLIGAAGLAYLLIRLHHYRLAIQTRRLRIEKERQLHDQMLQAKAEQLQQDVLNKSRELANSTFNLIRKNETLLEVKEALQKIKNDLGERLPDKYFQRMVRLIDTHLGDEQDWEVFETNFTQVHEIFLKKLKNDFPDLTPGDLRLAAYLKMNLSSKEIAPLLNISVRGVENKRYRLRRKLLLDNDANLTEFLMQYG